jgi:putative intracellular protease/amidase
MKIAIALFDRFTALDAIGPYEVLSRLPGADLVFVGESARAFRTDMGLAVVAGAGFADVPTADVLLVPGGPGTREMTQNQPLLDWVRRVHPTTQWTTSVCTGSLVLAAAGVLRGIDATTHWGAMGELAELGANPVQARVVERGKIMTAAGVSAGIDMALTLAARIAGEQVARAIQLGIEYDPQPPFDAGNARAASPELVQMVLGLMTARTEAAAG